MQAHCAGDGIDPRALAIRTDFAVALLPSKPRLLDRIRPRAAVHVGQIKRFAKAFQITDQEQCSKGTKRRPD